MNPKDFQKILKQLKRQGLNFEQWRELYLLLKLKPTNQKS